MVDSDPLERAALCARVFQQRHGRVRHPTTRAVASQPLSWSLSINIIPSRAQRPRKGGGEDHQPSTTCQSGGGTQLSTLRSSIRLEWTSGRRLTGVESSWQWPREMAAHAVGVSMRRMDTTGTAHAPPSCFPPTQDQELPRELLPRLSLRSASDRGGRGGMTTECTTQGLTSLPQGGLARSSSRGSMAASSDLDALFDDKPPSRARSPSPERTSPPPAVTKRPPLPHKGGAKVRPSTPRPHSSSPSLLGVRYGSARGHDLWPRSVAVYGSDRTRTLCQFVRTRLLTSLPLHAGVQAASLRGRVPHRARPADVRGWQRRRQRRRAQGQVAHLVHPRLRLLRCALTPEKEAKHTHTHTHSSESHLPPFARYRPLNIIRSSSPSQLTATRISLFLARLGRVS